MLFVLGLTAASVSSCAIIGRHVNHNTFYLSPSGSDSADGTSPQTAWRTLARADSARLRPGDHLLLEGGKRFSGQIRLGAREAGKPADPVRIGSYGSGRATIASSGESAIVIYDTSGVVIDGLNLTGESPAARESDGIKLYSNLPAGHTRLRHVVIAHVNVSGFTYGISIGATHASAGFADVAVSDSVLHDNLAAGLTAYGPAYDPAAPSYAHSDISITRVEAYRNRGNPADIHHNTGNGIVLGSVRDTTVRWSTAYDNGGAGGSRHEGPIGIWAYDSTHVIIEHCLSYDNKTANRRDGGGFGLDQNTSDSYLQYNLSYGNAGGGFQVYSPRDKSTTGNVVRFNISSGDARETINAAGIIVSGNVVGTSVYQNTVVMAADPGPAHAAFWAGRIRGVTVRNNVFMTEHPGPIIVSQYPLAPSDVLFQGNDYYTSGPSWSLTWGIGTTYTSMTTWRAATGQEREHGTATGMTGNPDFAGPVIGLAATSPAEPNIGSGFLPRRGSPLIGAGIDLRTLGVDPGPVTYSGQRLPKNKPNIGAQ